MSTCVFQYCCIHVYTRARVVIAGSRDKRHYYLEGYEKETFFAFSLHPPCNMKKNLGKLVFDLVKGVSKLGTYLVIFLVHGYDRYEISHELKTFEKKNQFNTLNCVSLVNWDVRLITS